MTKHWLMHKHANAKVEWIDRVKGKTQQRTTIQGILLYIIGSWIIGLFGSYHVGTMSKINTYALSDKSIVLLVVNAKIAC